MRSSSATVVVGTFMQWKNALIAALLWSTVAYAQEDWPHYAKDWNDTLFQARVLGVYDWIGSGPDHLETTEYTQGKLDYYQLATDNRDIRTFPIRIASIASKAPKDWIDRQDLIRNMSANAEIDPEFFQDKLTEDANADTYYLMGNIYFLQKRFPEAISYYQEALKKFRNFRLAFQNLAYAYYLTGNCEDALDAATKASELGAMNTNIKGLQGYCALQAGNYATAAQSISIARMLDGDNSIWKQLEIDALIHMKRYPQAEAMLHDRIADTQSLLNNIDSLLSVYRGNGEKMTLLSTLEIKKRLTGLNAPEQTELDMLKVAEGVGNFIADSTQEAQILYDAGNLSGALILLDEVVASYPTMCHALLLSAKIHEQQGDTDLVDRELFRARNAGDECNNRALIVQADVAFERGEFQRAYLLYREDEQQKAIAGEIQPYYRRQLLKHLARTSGLTVN